jgi:hypothetical protein
MAEYTYHSMDDLQKLGERVRDKAIKVTLDQEASYAQAQQRAVNDASRVQSGQQPQVPGYVPPARGRPDDHGNLEAYLGGAYASIPQLFTQFAMPDPDAAQPVLDALYKSAATLEPSFEIKRNGDKLITPLLVGGEAGTVPVQETVDTIRIHLKQWDGQAADAFEKYINDLKLSSVLQRQLVLSLAAALEVQLSIRRSVLTDIWEVGNKTIKALEELEGWCPGQREAKVQALLTIGGAIAAVVFVSVTGGSGAAIAAATGVEGLQSVAAILGAVPPLITKETIAGMTVPPILESMANVIILLIKRLNDQQQEVVRALRTTNQLVDKASNLFLMPAPAKLTAVAGANRAELEQAGGFYVR